MTKKKRTRKRKTYKSVWAMVRDLSSEIFQNIFINELNSKPIPCWKCKGTRWYQYDDNHSTVCNECCLHNEGWFKLDQHYGKDNGKMCCKGGCGFTRPPKNKKEKKEKGIWQKAQEESGYIDLSDQWD